MVASAKVPLEVIRLHKLGFAMHWLRPRSKIPIRAGWSKGPRLDLEELINEYRPGFNPGVRLGEASKIGDYYLAILDVDIKSTNPKHCHEAIDTLHTIYPQTKNGPYLLSGRGHGSAHYYVKLKIPVSGNEIKARSSDVVKVLMPSVKPNKLERQKLTENDLEMGVRLRPAWEIQLLSEGRQAAMVGAIHPDTGDRYKWGKAINGSGKDIPVIETEVTPLQGVTPTSTGDGGNGGGKVPRDRKTASRLEIEDADVENLDLRDELVRKIVDGTGVLDRSAEVYSLCMTMLCKGISEGVIRGVFTRRDYYLGQMAYDHAKTDNRQKAALWLEKYCLTKARQNASNKKNNLAFDIEEIPIDDKGVDTLTNYNKPNSWKGEIPFGVDDPPKPWEFKLIGDGKGKIAKTVDNLRLVLSNVGDPLIRRDLFGLKDYWGVKTPWGNKKGQERSGTDDDLIQIKFWFAKKYKIEPTVNAIHEAITFIALENSYHPLRDYLNGLVWDETERVENAFINYLGAKGDRHYLQAVSRKFFQACVQRAFHPGCKFDHMVVLEGPQDIGKSTFARVLAHEKWFIDGLPNFADKDAALYLQGSWICELSELAAMYKTTNESTKAFVTRTVDKFRPPYGRSRVDFKRTTVFIGTTNNPDYLTDRTGNRRFWPVEVTQCNFKALGRDKDQLWAEAVFKYAFDREPLWLEGDLKETAKGEQAKRLQSDETDIMEEKLIKWVRDEIKNGTPVLEVTLTDLFNGVFSQYPLKNARKACDVLRRAGFKNIRTKNNRFWRLDLN